MSNRSLVLLTALGGILGSITLVVSFRINPAPPADSSIAQLMEFAVRNRDAIVAGGWSRLLPLGFGLAALVLGVVLQVMGLVGLFRALQPVIDIILIIQAVWFVASSFWLIPRALPRPHRDHSAAARPGAGA